MLALLPPRPGEVVSVDALVEDLYGDRLPGDAGPRFAASFVRMNIRLLRFLPFLRDLPARMARRAASAITLPRYPG